MKKIMEFLTNAHYRLLCNEKGASMVEYALLVAAVAGASALLLGYNGTDDSISGGLMGVIKEFMTGISL